MTRITLIGPVYPYRGGIAHFTSQLADQLSKAGGDLQVISFKNQFPSWLYPGKSDRDTSSGRLQINASFLLSPLNPFSWYRTIQAIKVFNPDLVILPWWVTLWGPSFYSLLRGLKHFKKLIVIHNVIPHEPRFFDRWLTKMVLKKADEIITLSNREKNKLQNLMPGIGSVQVIPLPIFSVFPHANINKAQAREALELTKSTSPVILFFGFVRAYKGLDDLIKAIGLLKSRGCEVRLLIAGEFWEEKSTYVSTINRLEIASQVIIMDRYIPDHDIGLIFKASDVFVAPYISGSQSGAIMTAMAFGKPMVITELIAESLVYAHPELCIVVPPSRPEILANAIESSLNQQELDEETVRALSDKTWKAIQDAIQDMAG